LETIFKKFDITTTTVPAFLVLDLVLDNQRLVLEVDGFGEGSRDSMVGGFAFSNESLVAFNDRDGWVFDLPFANVTESLAANGGLLGSL
jgi:hypothetical protein